MPKKPARLKRAIPVLILILLLVLAYVFDLYRYLSFTELKNNHDALMAWRNQHAVLTILIFMLLYIIAVAVSFPGATILTLAGGFLFGLLWGTVYIVIAATIGAVILFLACRYAFAELFRQKAGKTLRRFEKGFQDDAFNYLLFLRLLPVFPFWLINIVPALLDMKLTPYIIATFLGIIPGTAVYVSVGNGLGSVFAAGKTPDFSLIFKPEIIIPIIALAILSVIPIIYKRVKRRKQ
jgi:uncharacterized membrane protein YdjX (TVP38/TMEM64 family)